MGNRRRIKQEEAGKAEIGNGERKNRVKEKEWIKKEGRMGDGTNDKRDIERKRKERPLKAVTLGSQRTCSEGNLKELFAGKRKTLESEGKEETERVEEWRDVFKRSKVVQHSPEKGGGGAETWRVMSEKIGEAVGREVAKVETRVEEMAKGFERRVEEIVKEAKREREELISRWEEDKRRMMERIEELEGRMKGIEAGEKEDRGEGSGQAGRVNEPRMEGVERKLREMDIRLDKRESEKRRNNVIIRGVKMRGGGELGGGNGEVMEQNGDREGVKGMKIVGGRTDGACRAGREGKQSPGHEGQREAEGREGEGGGRSDLDEEKGEMAGGEGCGRGEKKREESECGTHEDVGGGRTENVG